MTTALGIKRIVTLAGAHCRYGAVDDSMTVSSSGDKSREDQYTADYFDKLNKDLRVRNMFKYWA